MYHWNNFTTKVADWLKFNRVLLLLLVVFLLLRLPGLHLTYHQDEVKWVTHATTIGDDATGKGHPPLSGLILPIFGKILGPDNMRAVPLFFGLLNFGLLYLLAKKLFGKVAAYWSLLLFTLAFYSVLASLMVDLDGQFLPFFVLLLFNSFFLWREADSPRAKKYWAVGLMVAIGLGFMAKLNFIIPVMALVGFYILDSGKLRWDIKVFVHWVGVALAGVGLIMLSLLLARYFLPTFNLERVFAHASDHFNFFGRDYLQVIFQTGKALLYSSPLLLAPIFLVSRAEVKKTKLFFWFLFFGAIFYYLLFDFSRAALDKYLAFVIVPLCLIGGVVSQRVFGAEGKLNKKVLWGGGVIIVALFLTQFIGHFIPALYPKGEWLGRIASLRWNFLMPFTGGSGPLGFYVSFLFMALAWLGAIVLVILARVVPAQRKSFLALLFVLGLVYNLSMIEEYALGKINGNSTGVLNKALSYIADSSTISSVITYNDIGGYELAQMGKYERRIYVAPKNDTEHKQTLNNFKKYYLVVDIPRLSPDSIYAKYFSTCRSIYFNQSQQVSATVYDCRKAVDLK